MDYVFIPSENRIYILRTSISFEVFLIIAVLTIHISIVMAHNMEILLGLCHSFIKQFFHFLMNFGHLKYIIINVLS
jgi:hypothetical protein